MGVHCKHHQQEHGEVPSHHREAHQGDAGVQTPGGWHVEDDGHRDACCAPNSSNPTQAQTKTARDASHLSPVTFGSTLDVYKSVLAAYYYAQSHTGSNYTYRYYAMAQGVQPQIVHACEGFKEKNNRKESECKFQRGLKVSVAGHCQW